MACCQQPAGDGSTQTAAQLHTERSAGVHRAIHALMLRQPSIFRASSNHSVHIALPRTLTKSCDCSKEQHQGHIAAAHVTSYSNQCTRNRCQSIAHYIQLIHSIPLCNQGRGEHQCDDQRNVDCPREYTEQILVAKDVGCIVGAHADHGTVDLLQNVGDANHHIIFVTSKQLCSLNQIVLFVLLDFLFVGGIHQFAFRQFLHGENGEGVDKQTDDGVDDCNSAPTGSTTAQCRNSTQRDGLDEQAGGKGEHETPRTHLDLFGTVLRDESSQCRVSNVVGSVEYSVQQSICNQEPCVLCKLSQIGRDGENCHQRNGTANVAVQHPRTGFAHLRMRFVNQRTKENVRHTVQQFGNCNQSADNTGVQANGVGQIDHDEGGQECIHHVARNIA